MQPSTGHLAFMAAIGGGFRPKPYDHVPWDGVDQGNGTFRTEMTHPDGRALVLMTKPGNGWQRGKLIGAVANGPWRVKHTDRMVSNWWEVRALLAHHEPDREEPYCGGAPIRQARKLDGRERDILCRIISEINRALRDPESQELLLRVIYLEQDEVDRLSEVRTVLEPRDD